MTRNDDSDDIITWKVSIISPLHFLPALEESIYGASGNYIPSITAFEIKDDLDNRLVEIYYDHEPDTDKLAEAISNMASIFNIGSPHLKLEQLDDINWVAQSQKILEPIDAGRFFLYGGHDFTSIPADKISIQMEAGQAFGTGNHETTKGCLLAISDLHQKINPATMLDLGCGSGVLAIAMAKQWPGKVVASDIDPIATNTAKDNIKLNDAGNILAITCDGFENSILGESGPYDLIVANILAEPLRLLASDIVGNLSSGAFLVLSGLLKEQQDAVLEAYLRHEMELEGKFPINEWQTLVMRKN